MTVPDEPLFDDDGFINQRVDRKKIFDYIYFSETDKHYASTAEEFLLGVDDGIAYYYFPDRELNYDLLATIRTRATAYVIYADKCTLSENFPDEHRITFKKNSEQHSPLLRRLLTDKDNL